MPLPVLQKSWQYNVNQAPISSHSDLLYKIKNSMVSFSSNPWTVVSSSNSSVANTNDNWTGSGSVVFQNNGSAHSWIVLKQVGIATNFQVLIVARRNPGGGSDVMFVLYSMNAGFTGGTTTARPTATDEQAFDSDNASLVANSANLASTPARLHVMQSTDGQCTRVFIYVNSIPQTMLLFDKPRNPVSGWTIPHVAMYAVQQYNSGASVAQVTYAKLNDAADRVKSRVGTTNFNMFLTSEGCITSMIGEQQTFVSDLDSSAYPMLPMGLFSTTSGARGRHGELFDIYWGSTIINEGDHYPGDSSKQFVQFGDIIHPWNGSTILIA